MDRKVKTLEQATRLLRHYSFIMNGLRFEDVSADYSADRQAPVVAFRLHPMCYDMVGGTVMRTYTVIKDRYRAAPERKAVPGWDMLCPVVYQDEHSGRSEVKMVVSDSDESLARLIHKAISRHVRDQCDASLESALPDEMSL